MSRQQHRQSVPCYGLELVLSQPANGSIWMIELYKNYEKAQFIQLVATVGGAGQVPRFCAPIEPSSQHCVWLDGTYFELPEKSWKQLKAWFEKTAAVAEVSA
ncbi:hypothetical protein [Xanthomonas cannabis]|uniref:hypothetical protein n=1 Tax=Xanthomonas cannabis TaxID=1885674 RepID=UPI00141B23CC|nr:hypothetical protein [Xanthomonas cannabis]NIK62626.1 hypothetical protein [Xanthomonas cannabis]